MQRPEVRGDRRSGSRPRRVRQTAAVPLPQLLDVKDVAEVLGVTVRHVRRLVAERRIPFLKWGHYLRFDPREIASWLEGARVVASQRATTSREWTAR